MIDVESLRQRLAGLTYRPGWSLRIKRGEFEGDQLVINALVQDAYAPDRLIALDIHTPLPPFQSIGQFDRWVLWRLVRVETHEAMELLHGPDDRPLFDPHRPNADRDDPVE